MNAVHRQKGVALVLVLWLTVLLTVIAASHAKVIRTETRLASNHVVASKARSLAEAGAHHAIMELLVRDVSQRWPVDGRVNRIDYTDGAVAISVRDTRGLVDINNAQAPLLHALLSGMGVDEATRSAVVDATLDWRDQDALKHLNGAEDDDYRRSGLQWAARDGAFSSVEEFRYVLGMTNSLYERLAPYLTVHSGQAAVMLDFAPPWLAGVLDDATGVATQGGTTWQLAGSTYRVSVLATTQDGSVASLDLVVRLSPTDETPYTILSWRAPARSFSLKQG